MPSAARPTRIVILTSLRQELRPLIRRLNLSPIAASFHGEYRGLAITALTTGMGGVRATEWLSRVVRDLDPQVLILAGFAGALKPDLPVGQVIHAAAVVNEAGQAWQLSSAPPLPPRCVQRAQAPQPVLLSARRPALNPEDKARLYQASGAPALDMESADVAQRAVSAGLPLIILRAISDTAADTIPPSVLDWIDDAGRCKLAAAADGILRRPWLLPAVMRLHRHSRVAGQALAQQVVALLDRLAGGTAAKDPRP